MFQKHTEILREKTAASFQVLIENDPYTAYVIPNAASAAKLRDIYRFNPAQQSAGTEALSPGATRRIAEYPKMMPFSEMVFSCAERCIGFVTEYYNFARGFPQLSMEKLDNLLFEVKVVR